MTCPNCKTVSPRGTVICPVCDEILDAGSFDVEPAEAFDEKTGAMELGEEDPDEVEPSEPVPPRRPVGLPPRASSVAVPPANTTRSVADAQPRAASPAAVKPSDPRKAPAAKPAPKAKGRRRPIVKPTASADKVLADGWAGYRSLPAFEQLSLASMLVCAVAMLFPWRVTDLNGEEIGLLVGGWALVPLGLAGAALWVRTTQDLRGFTPEQLGVAQLLGGLGVLAYCAVFFWEAIDASVYRSALGATNLHASSPEFGCVACAVGAVGLAASGAWAYLEERGVS